MNSVISINSDILSGMPVFNGTRVPIKNLFDYLETGNTVEIFLDEFPSVKKEQALAVLELAENFVLSNISFYENINRRVSA